VQVLELALLFKKSSEYLDVEPTRIIIKIHKLVKEETQKLWEFANAGIILDTNSKAIGLIMVLTVFGMIYIPSCQYISGIIQ